MATGTVSFNMVKIVRKSPNKLSMVYCMINFRFLAQIGALVILDEGDNIMDLKDIFRKCADRRYGCTWGSFEAYRYGIPFFTR